MLLVLILLCHLEQIEWIVLFFCKYMKNKWLIIIINSQQTFQLMKLKKNHNHSVQSK